MSSLEEQQHDLLVYFQTVSNDVEQTLRNWQQSQPFLDWIPDSAKGRERILFNNAMSRLLMLSLKQSASFQTPSIEHAADDPAHSLLSRLNERWADSTISLKSLGNEMHLSEQHLGRCFKRLTGQHFRHYLRDLRVNEAKTLLMHSRLSIAIIAVMTGYSDPSYFGKDFKAITGQTPLDFRTKYAADRLPEPSLSSFAAKTSSFL